MKTRILFFCSILIAGACLQAAKRLPVETFFRNPDITQCQISPDGKNLAMLAPWEGYMNLYVFDLDKRDPMVLTGEHLDVTAFFWANNERLIYSLNQYTFGNYENRYRGGWFAINKDGKKHRVLVEPYGAGDQIIKYAPATIGIMHRLEEDDEHILVSNNERQRRHPDVYKLNIYTGGMKRVFNNPARINGYFVDEMGVVRFGTSRNPDATVSRMYRPAGSEEWIETQAKAEDYEVISPLSIAYSKDIGVVSSNSDRDKRALYRINFKTGQMSSKPFLENDTYDIEADPIFAYSGKGFVGLRYETDKPQKVFYEDSHKQLQAIIDQTIPDGINTVINHSEDGSRLVISSISATRPREYYLLHLDGLKIELLAKTMPWLDKVDLCGAQPISYKARDGRIIHGYLTLPKSYKPGKPVPLIVNPHGGPWARDYWGIRSWYDMEPEFYANRGFAVLKPNFRGSTGYGKDHLKSSFKKMEDMHNDVMDGVLWAIEQGFADKDKVGIAGASWGGYATMVALTKNPEMFKFGINVFGVVDLVEHINWYKKEDREEAYEYWLKRIGDPRIDEDLANLKKWSGMNYLENLDDPLFIYHGKYDFNVDIDQSRTLVRKLKGLGKKEGQDFWYVERKDEAHSAFDEENRIDLYKQIDAFLDRVSANW